MTIKHLPYLVEKIMPKISVASVETIAAAWASYAAYSTQLIPARELEEFRQVFYDGFGIALVMLHESADLEKSEKLQKEYFDDCLAGRNQIA